MFVTTHSYPPQRFGGSESSTHELCESLIRYGVKPLVLSYLDRTRPWRNDDSMPDHFLDGRFAVVDESLAYPIIRAIDPIAYIETVISRFKPDVAVIQSGKQLACLSALSAYGLPTLVYVRDVEFHRLGGRYWLAPKIAYAANSEFTGSMVARAFGIDAEVIPPLVQSDRYRTENLGIHLTFINPRPAKGVEIALALAKLRPDINFMFVECWPLTEDERQSYRSRADALGNILWHTATSDMKEIYRQTRMLLVPSRWQEGWGRVATEAQVSGIPVIASRIGGLPESVGPGGILVEPEASIEHWVDALSLIWDDVYRYERYSAAAVEFSKRPSIVPEHLLNCLCSLLYRLCDVR